MVGIGITARLSTFGSLYAGCRTQENKRSYVEIDAPTQTGRQGTTRRLANLIPNSGIIMA